MTYIVHCPACGQALSVKPAMHGQRRLVCPRCGKQFRLRGSVRSSNGADNSIRDLGTGESVGQRIFLCPHCSQHLRVPIELAGRQAICPKCHGHVRIPVKQSCQTQHPKAPISNWEEALDEAQRKTLGDRRVRPGVRSNHPNGKPLLDGVHCPCCGDDLTEGGMCLRCGYIDRDEFYNKLARGAKCQAELAQRKSDSTWGATDPKTRGGRFGLFVFKYLSYVSLGTIGAGILWYFLGIGGHDDRKDSA